MIKTYTKLKKNWDLQYQKPKKNDLVIKNFTIREFYGFKFPNHRSRNFFIIIKVLAENGYCTINEIIDNDGLSQSSKNRKKRHDVYDRLIKGERAKFDGLLDKWVVEVEIKKNMMPKRKKRYRLTFYGMLYAISLFSEDTGDYIICSKYNDQIKYEVNSTTKYKKKIIDVLVENYSDKLPLIFKKWEFMVSEFGTLVDFLVGFAHFTDNFKEGLQQDVLLSTKPVHMKEWDITDLTQGSELSVLFFAWIGRHDYECRSKFVKDKKIFDLYKRYVELVKKEVCDKLLLISYQEFMLNSKDDKAKKALKKLREL